MFCYRLVEAMETRCGRGGLQVSSRPGSATGRSCWHRPQTAGAYCRGDGQPGANQCQEIHGRPRSAAPESTSAAAIHEAHKAETPGGEGPSRGWVCVSLSKGTSSILTAKSMQLGAGHSDGF